jgi:hypothetical protein
MTPVLLQIQYRLRMTGCYADPYERFLQNEGRTNEASKDESGDPIERRQKSHRQPTDTSATEAGPRKTSCSPGNATQEKTVTRDLAKVGFLTHGRGPTLRAGNVANRKPHVPRLIQAGPCPPHPRNREMPGKDSKCLRGEVQEGRSPFWGPRSGPAAMRSEQPLYL